MNDGAIYFNAPRLSLALKRSDCPNKNANPKVGANPHSKTFFIFTFNLSNCHAKKLHD